jgi:hypothetical protein
VVNASEKIVAMKIFVRVGRDAGPSSDHSTCKTSHRPLFDTPPTHANAIRNFTHANQRGTDSVESKLESAFASTSGPCL